MLDGSENDSFTNFDDALRFLNYFLNLIPTVSSHHIYHLSLIGLKL